MYVIYWTVYHGKKMPKNYIGFTSLKKHQQGYKGSVNSIEWKSIWKEELQNHPELFKSYIIEYVNGDINLALLAERKWQLKYNAATNPLFINRSYAKGGFIGTKASAAKSVQTRIQKGIKCTTPESIKKSRETKIKNGTLHRSPTQETINKSLETKRIKGTTSGSKSVIEKGIQTKIKNENLNIMTPDVISKILDTKKRNGTLNVMTPDTVAKQLATKRKNETLNITTPETIAKGLETKLRKYGTLNIWTPALLAKRSLKRKGRKSWTDGKNVKYSFECPGNGWFLGRPSTKNTKR